VMTDHHSFGRHRQIMNIPHLSIFFIFITTDGISYESKITNRKFSIGYFFLNIV